MNKEDEIANFIQDLKDIKSSIKVLQSAIQNEFNPPELNDIGNSIEIILSNYTKIVEKAEDIVTI